MTAAAPPWCDVCHAALFRARTPSGRAVSLGLELIYIEPGEPWPTALFSVVDYGTFMRVKPAVEYLDREADGTSGPFLRQHRCGGRPRPPRPR